MTACGSDPPPPSRQAVRIEVDWGGASAASVEREVLEPLEQATGSLTGLVGMRGVARYGVATLDLLLGPDVELDGFVGRAREAIVAAQRQLPEGASPPMMRKLVRPAAVVTAIVVPPGDVDALTLGARVDALRDRVARLNGVAAIAVCGAAEAELRVTLDGDALAARGLGVDRVLAALRTESSTPLGRIDGRDGLPVRVVGRPTTAATLGELRIDPIVRLSDVARVEHTVAPGCVARTSDGRAAILQVTVRDRGAIRAVVAALRDGGARVYDHELVTSELSMVGVAMDERVALASRLIEAGAAAALVPSDRVAIELLVDADPRTADGETQLAALDQRIARVGYAVSRWDGRGVRAIEAVVAAPELDPILDAARALTGATIAPTRTPARDVTIDRSRAAALGITTAAIADALQVAVGGAIVASIDDGARHLDVRVVGSDAEADDHAYEHARVTATDGTLVPLSALVTMTAQLGLDRILREDRVRVVRVWVRTPRGGSDREVRRAIDAALPGARWRAAEPNRDRW